MDVSMVIRMGHDRMDDFPRVVDYVVEGERLGAGMVWSSEAWVHDCVSPLAFFAARTSRIRLGTGIMQTGTRSPALVAMTALTLQQMSEGRFVLGLGTSGPQVIEGWHGIPFEKPITRLKEVMEIVRQISRGERLYYQGEVYKLPREGGEGKALRSPIEPRPVPVYMGSLGPRALQIVGELADGWICPQFMPETRDVYFQHIEKGAARSGRDLSTLDVQCNVSVQFTDDVERAVRKHKAKYAFSIGAMGSANTNFYVQSYTRAGFGDGVQRVQSLWLERRREEAALAVPDEIVLRQNLIGTESMIRERLRAYRDAGVRSLRLMPEGETQAQWYDTERLGRLVALAKEVSDEVVTPA